MFSFLAQSCVALACLVLALLSCAVELAGTSLIFCCGCGRRIKIEAMIVANCVAAFIIGSIAKWLCQVRSIIAFLTGQAPRRRSSSRK